MSSTTTYDASVALDGKLTQEQTHELKILLVPHFHAAAAADDNDNDNDNNDEDINDFLDYAFAMVNNQKSVEYVIKELVGMEMEFCNPTIAENVGSELSRFLQTILKGGKEGGEEEEEVIEEGNTKKDGSNGNGDGDGDGEMKDGKISSLKVGSDLVTISYCMYMYTVLYIEFSAHRTTSCCRRHVLLLLGDDSFVQLSMTNFP